MRPPSGSWSASPEWCKRAWSGRVARCFTAGCASRACLPSSPVKQRLSPTSGFATSDASSMWCAPAVACWNSIAPHSWCATSRSSVRRGMIHQPPMLIPILMRLPSSPFTRRRGWSSPSYLPRTSSRDVSRPRVDRRVSRSLQSLAAPTMWCPVILVPQMDQQRQTKRRCARSDASPTLH